MHLHLVEKHNVLMSLRPDFMNFMQTGRYKTNVDAECHFHHFLSSRLIDKNFEILLQMLIKSPIRITLH